MKNITVGLITKINCLFPTLEMTKMTYRIRPLLAMVLFCLLISLDVAAQDPGNGIIKGKIIDSVSAAPVSFATIRVFNSADKKLVNGDISHDAGDFSFQIPFGKYYAEIDFMGYESHTTQAIEISENKPEHNLGTIKLATSVSQLDEVVVQAEKSTMELSLDKKVFNVGQDLANAGGSANDILMNIPSVSVDPEGGIKLRGSDNVRILIDGKPSGLVSFKGGSGLQQLQASMIERVEVITNPSARYEAEGMAGIINIVLKKERNQGFNGSFEVITGHPVNFGGAANLNYRHKKINFFINYSIAYREQPGVGRLYQELYDMDTTDQDEIYRGDTISYLRQNTNGWVTGFNTNIRGGLDYYFNEKNILTVSYLYRRSKASRYTNILYQDYLFDLDNMTGYTTRRQDEDEIEPNSEYSIIYKKSYQQKGHELTAEVKFLDNWESSDQTFTMREYSPDAVQQDGTIERSLNDEFEKQWLFQLDYTKPIGKEGKIETGVRTSFRDMINDYIVTRENDGGSYDTLPGLDNVFVYDENIHAVYGIIGNKTNRFSYQAGLRAEWTDVKTTLRETNVQNPRKYTNLFPSAHFTFDLPKENALQISYSRRVRRPFYNDLSPFMTFSDSRNFFSGNPDLNPEFSNVFEVGHVKYFDKGSFSSSVYYRDTKDKIERIRAVDNGGNSVTLPQNLKSEKAMGIEFTSGYSPTEWWKLDVNFNFFHADIDGSNIIETYKASTYSWFVRQTSRFTLPKSFDIQIRGNYEAPQNTAQGRRKSLYYADFSMSKDVLKGRGTINFNILDIFNTRRIRSISEGINFYTDSNFQARRRQFNLTFNYRIKQAKQAKKTLEE
jgi:ferric enterobactin receptor